MSSSNAEHFPLSPLHNLVPGIRKRRRTTLSIGIRSEEQEEKRKKKLKRMKE